MDKKKIAWTLISILLAVLSMRVVLAEAGTVSLKDLTEMMEFADWRWLAAAIIAMLGFIFFEAEALLTILRNVGYGTPRRESVFFAAADVYFSAITPSATGGQPASALFMMRSGIPMFTTTVVLITNLIMYVLGILTVGVVCMITAPHVFFHFNLLSKILIITGYLAQGGLLTCFFILLRRRDLMEKLCAKLLWILHKIHLVRDIDKKRLRLEKKMDEYQACVEQMGDRRGALLKAYFWNLMQRVSQISVTMFMFLAIGGNFEDAYNIWATQSMVVIGSNTVPIPGGDGGSGLSNA